MPTTQALANEIAQRYPDKALFVYMHIVPSPNTAKQLASARLEAMFSHPEWQHFVVHVISQPAQLPSISTSAFFKCFYTQTS